MSTKETRCRRCDRIAIPFDSEDPPPSLIELAGGKKAPRRLNAVGFCKPCNIEDLRFHGQAVIDEARATPLLPKGTL
jgi:hypothetical protein